MDLALNHLSRQAEHLTNVTGSPSLKGEFRSQKSFQIPCLLRL